MTRIDHGAPGMGHFIWDKLNIDSSRGIALCGSEMLCGLKLASEISSDMFRFCHFDLHLRGICRCIKSANWKQVLGKLWFIEQWMIKTTIQVLRKILGNFSRKYWKRRSFVMIVNWGMLTKKTDEIGAAMWAQRAPNNKMLFIYEIVFVFVPHTSYGYWCDKGYNNAVWDRWDENLWMNILESHLGSCLPLPVSGSVSEPWKSPNGSVVVLL